MRSAEDEIIDMSDYGTKLVVPIDEREPKIGPALRSFSCESKL